MAEGVDRGARGSAHVARDLLLLAGLVLLATVPGLFTRDLWNPDEPRYTEVAREMVVLGDYIVPHLNGEIYAEKPPLFFWLTAGFWKLGAGDLSGRLVTMLAVFGTLALIYLAVRGPLGRRQALLAAVVSLTTMLLSYLSRRGVIDPLLMFCTTAAALAGYQAMRPTAERRGLWWVACYAALGLGTLEKGPVGLLVPALILLVYGLMGRRQVRAGGWWHLAGTSVFLVVVLPWLVAACVSGGKAYTDVILFKQQLGRAFDSYSHNQPFYYYLWNGPVALWPWILVLPLGVIAAWRRRRDGAEPLALFAMVWLIVPFLLFSAFSAKRMNYLLPIVPGAGILVAWYFSAQGVREGGLLRAERVLLRVAFWAATLIGTAVAVGAVLAGPLLKNASLTGRLELSAEDVAWLQAYFTPARVALAVALALPPIAVGLLGLRAPAGAGRFRAALLAAAMLLLFLPLDLVGNQAENVFKSGRRFSLEIKKHVGPATPVYLYPNDFSGVYNLYSGIPSAPGAPSMSVVNDEGKLRTILATPGTLIVADGKRVEKLLSPQEMARHVVYEEGVGHRQMVLLRGLGPAEPASAGSGFGAGPILPRRLWRVAEGAEPRSVEPSRSVA